ncbi:sensor domain-containing diguanylate cyclase [Ancylobacter sp. SL191]|uniref:GGDEF domain-containing protein n=1 Tax=Ancylobacter sp. SL191 TaxID=2995166 RepID=UPI002270C61D|nr:GGDEF domain-containing protein [Ancylobacter sp. SL191]WAC26910.1 GGDEF domain-containing protein [Ancylobacter sp. SL191]
MLLDYVTLLAAVGISAACLSGMIFISWLMNPKDSFLLTCAAGGALCGAGLLLYGFYVVSPHELIAVPAFGTVMTGLAVLVGAGYRFRTHRSPRRLVIITAVLANLVALPALMAGYTGLGFVPVNFTAAALLFFIAWQYAGARSHAPTAISGLCALYAITGASFALCGLMVAIDGRPTLAAAPNGWAEDLSLLVMIACVPGIGAVTLTLNQTRLASELHRAAMTDSLTGLMNRRALFDALSAAPVAQETAVIVFDIDRFKSINDTHGHAVGDRVIETFAQAMMRDAPTGALMARLGGEEFALVTFAASADEALRLAEQICHAFTRRAAGLGMAGFRSTASAGFAFGVAHGATFEQVLSEADKALYAAKRGGRNRVMSAEPRLFG